MTAAKDLYQAVIVEHDRHPRHHGPLPGANREATVDNPMCGDVVTVRLIVDDGVVREIAFDGHGCALSRAAASLMTERVCGMHTADVPALTSEIDVLVAAPPDAPIDANLGDLAALAGVRRFKSRRTCATLPFRALAAAVKLPHVDHE